MRGSLLGQILIWVGWVEGTVERGGQEEQRRERSSEGKKVLPGVAELGESARLIWEAGLNI